MILGRPTNLWLALSAAILAFVQVLIVTLRPELDPVSVATVLGSLGGLLAIVIAFVANQPPTVNTGDKVNVITPAGEPNKTIAV